MAQTVLVTGANGYVGSWCIVELLTRGYAVRATLRSVGKADAVRGMIAPHAPVEGLSFIAADLMADAGWEAAMMGVDYVLHVASPLGGGVAGDRESLVAPAREGTLRVLGAAARAGVKRVVMTSAAATTRQRLSHPVRSDETMWADPEDPQFDAYRVSKIRAEKAAWEFMWKSGGATEFTTILPGAVFGPVLSADNLGSVRIVKDLAEGRPPRMPRLGFWVVDVRDLAAAHVRAMIEPKAAGQRFIVAGNFLWMEEMAQALREGLGADGTKVPRKRLPGWAVRLLVPFMPQLRTLAPLIGRRFEMDTGKARRVLGFNPRPAGVTLVDCARSVG